MSITREEVAQIIWPQLQNCKFKEIYIDLLLEKYQKRDRAINIFLVIITSSSISAWAIWKLDYLQWVWAVLVAISQIVILVKPYLNYSKYIKELNEKYYQIQAITRSYEKLWHHFRFDKLDFDACCEKEFELRDALTDCLKFSDGVILPDDSEFAEKARQKVLTYLKNSYSYKEPNN